MPIPAEYAKTTPSILARIRANVDAMVANRNRRVCPVDDGMEKNVTKFGTGQITLTTVAQQIVGFRRDRIGIKITNLTTSQVFIGPSFSVSPSNGDLLSAGIGQWNSYDTRSPIYGVVATGTANVSYSEVYE